MICYERLVDRMNEANISLASLAKKLDLQRDCLVNIFYHGAVPKTTTLWSICKYFDCDVDSVIQFKDDKYKGFKASVKVDWDRVLAAMKMKGITLYYLNKIWGRSNCYLRSRINRNAGLQGIEYYSLMKRIGDCYEKLGEQDVGTNN